jgi:hypothetical protein
MQPCAGVVRLPIWNPLPGQIYVASASAARSKLSSWRLDPQATNGLSRHQAAALLDYMTQLTSEQPPPAHGRAARRHGRHRGQPTAGGTPEPASGAECRQPSRQDPHSATTRSDPLGAPGVHGRRPGATALYRAR